jgi:hypothetical protein
MLEKIATGITKRIADRALVHPRVVRFLGRHPKLATRLRDLAIAAVPPESAPSNPPQAPGQEDLSPRVRSIHANLVRAIRQKRGGR